MSFVKKSKLIKKGNQKSHKDHLNKLSYTPFNKRTIAPHGQKAYEKLSFQYKTEHSNNYHTL